jgi:hypothetical protein
VCPNLKKVILTHNKITSLSSLLPINVYNEIIADEKAVLQKEADKWMRNKLKQEKEEKGEEEAEENSDPSSSSSSSSSSGEKDEVPQEAEEEEDEDVVKKKEKDRKAALVLKWKNDVKVLPSLVEVMNLISLNIRLYRLIYPVI